MAIGVGMIAKKRNFLISENRGILSDSIRPPRNARRKFSLLPAGPDSRCYPVSDEAGFSLTASGTNRSGPSIQTVLVDN